MSSLLINPHYCPEDKDILDFINSSSISAPELTQQLRQKGVYVSKDAKKEDLALLLIQEVYTWEDVSELLAMVHLPTPREHFITGSHSTAAQFESLEDAVQNVKDFRLNKYGDRVNIESVGADAYKITIDYTKIDYEKTRLIQCVEREAEILIERTPEGFKTQRTDDNCAAQVELAILGEFERLAQQDDLEVISERLKLSALPTIEKRVKFFVDLMEGLKNYEFQQINSARVQSFKPEIFDDDDDADEDISEEYKSAVESLIINGKNVGGSEIYDSVVGKDFFISSATWTVVSDTDEVRRAEVKAAFVPVLKDFELQLSVSYVWLFRSDELQPKSKANQFQRDKFAALLRESAENAYRNAN